MRLVPAWATTSARPWAHKCMSTSSITWRKRETFKENYRTLRTSKVILHRELLVRQGFTSNDVTRMRLMSGRSQYTDCRNSLVIGGLIIQGNQPEICGRRVRFSRERSNKMGVIGIR